MEALTAACCCSESQVGGIFKGRQDLIQGSDLHPTGGAQSLLPHVDLVLLLVVRDPDVKVTGDVVPSRDHMADLSSPLVERLVGGGGSAGLTGVVLKQ